MRWNVSECHISFYFIFQKNVNATTKTDKVLCGVCVYVVCVWPQRNQVNDIKPAHVSILLHTQASVCGAIVYWCIRYLLRLEAIFKIVWMKPVRPLRDCGSTCLRAFLIKAICLWRQTERTLRNPSVCSLINCRLYTQRCARAKQSLSRWWCWCCFYLFCFYFFFDFVYRARLAETNRNVLRSAFALKNI